MKKTVSLLCITAAVSILTVCACEEHPDYTENNGIELVAKVAEQDTTIYGFTEANNYFAIESFKVLCEAQDTNIVYSPMSVFSSLLCLKTGANGETLKQINDVLFLNSLDSTLTNSYKEIFQLYDNVNARYKLHGCKVKFANSLWVDKQYELKPEFEAQIHELGNFDVFKADFKFNFSSTIANIQNWMNAVFQTEYKTELLNRLVPRTNFALFSIVDLDLAWSEHFNSDITKPDTFYSFYNTEVLDFMSQEVYYSFHENNVFRYLEIPYVQKFFTFGILLPIENTPAAFQKTLDNLNLLYADMGCESTLIDLKLPKIGIKNTIELISMLKKMGLTYLFDVNCDLSNMLMEERGMCVTEGIQESAFEINEKGTKVKTITMFDSRDMAGIGGVEPIPLPFYVNHPFIFIIKDFNDNIIYLGKYQ